VAGDAAVRLRAAVPGRRRRRRAVEAPDGP